MKKKSAFLKIPVIEEQLRIDKKVVQTGTVSISKEIREEDVEIETPVIRELVDIEHVPINQYVEKSPEIRHEGDTMVIPVLREEVVVTKRWLLVEEIRVTKSKAQAPDSQVVKVRKEEVIFNRIADENSI